jgi:hypothetical protein
MSEDRLLFLAGILIGCIGLIMLVHLDVPVIQRGGIAAVLALLELTLALAFLTTAVTLHAREL